MMSSAATLANKPISILKDSTISDVIRKLLDNNISRILVRDSGSQVGIITEKDVGFFLFNETTKQSLDQMPLTKIMKDISYADENEPVKNCARMMTHKNISSLLLGSVENSFGIITKTDLAKYYAQNCAGRHKVVDYMTHNYVSTHSAAPLSKVVKKMFENNVSRLVVMNQMEHPIGIVSLRDLFRISLDLGSEEDATMITLSDKVRRGFLSSEGFGGLTVARDVMTKGIISIKFDKDLADAGSMLLQNKINGLAVLDGNDKIVGMISKTDITRALAD